MSRDIHFEQIAKVLNIDVNQIKQLNPQYRRNIINGNTKPSAVRLPATLVSSFIDNEDSIYAYRPEELLAKRTEVEVNNTTPTYSRSNTSSSRSHSSASSRRGRHSKKKRSRGGHSITIRQGDTLSEIAARNGTTVKKLKRLNKISGSSIRAPLCIYIQICLLTTRHKPESVT